MYLNKFVSSESSDFLVFSIFTWGFVMLGCVVLDIRCLAPYFLPVEVNIIKNFFEWIIKMFFMIFHGNEFKLAKCLIFQLCSLLLFTYTSVWNIFYSIFFNFLSSAFSLGVLLEIFPSFENIKIYSRGLHQRNKK